MKYSKIIALIPESTLEEVEQALLDHRVAGMTIMKAHGMGEYKNFYAKDFMSDCARLEIVEQTDRVRELTDTIARVVHQGLSTDGVIIVSPVDEFIHISQFEES